MLIAGRGDVDDHISIAIALRVVLDLLGRHFLREATGGVGGGGYLQGGLAVGVVLAVLAVGAEREKLSTQIIRTTRGVFQQATLVRRRLESGPGERMERGQWQPDQSMLAGGAFRSLGPWIMIVDWRLEFQETGGRRNEHSCTEQLGCT